MRSAKRLYYTQPAQQWVEALPLGNGRMGAMVFGGTDTERIALNEDTLWSGYPHRYARKNAPEAIARAQELVRVGKLVQAQALIEEEATAEFVQAYMPLGDILLSFPDLRPETDDYVRELDLETGIHTVTFSRNGITYKREMFISHPAQALVLRLTASCPGAINVDMRLTTQLRMLEESIAEEEQGTTSVLRAICPSNADPHYVSSEEQIYYGDTPAEKGIHYCAMAKMMPTGGIWGYGNGAACVRDADAVEIRFFVRTSFDGYQKHPWLEGRNCGADVRNDIAAIAQCTYAQLLEKHTEDFSAIMNRCDFHIDAKRSEMPTIERLRSFRETQYDPELYELLFQYGRYLTVSASRVGSEPMNLQGIWNESLVPPWSSNYTININTEMNYWPAEPANLSDLAEPLFRFTEELCEKGKEAAQDFYGARGSVAHHNSDLWRHPTPVGNRTPKCLVWAFWPMSLGWLCRHLFDHYLYSGDQVFLREKVLPILREAALFYCDTVRENGSGSLSIFPATSPENHFFYDGEDIAGAPSVTMQDAIIREVFDEFAQTLEILGLTDDLSDTIAQILPRIRPYTIGSKGQLLEWTEEYEEAEPHHRHQSHLYPLHPGTQITENTPALMQACARSLELRGDDGTGWSLGWKINLWARLGQGDHALKLLNMQLRLVGDNTAITTKGGGTYPNLFDAHPPFQIDGNFGATAGICEMLLRSRPDTMILLPALPSAWRDGEVRGLCAMGEMTVDISFADGRLSSAQILCHRTPNKPVSVLYDGNVLLSIDKAGTYRL